MQILRQRSPHSNRLERWLGADRIEQLAGHMRGWYGPPIHLGDVPGGVAVAADGDFVGDFDRGAFHSALDALDAHFRQLRKRINRERRLGEALFGVGFTSISDALSRASSGYGQTVNVYKPGPTGVQNSASTLWRVGGQPSAGATPSAAPGGNAPTRTTAGALAQVNPASGTLHLVGADIGCNVLGNTALLYDRIFHVAKTMNSTATEAVTGVPTRYQSTTAGDADYIGGNFLFIEVGGTALAATAHNWTTCTYTDQANAASTLPSVTGNSGAIVDRLDMPLNTWFCPLEAGDVGIKALTQMQCSAAVATGAINFVIGHPLKFLMFPIDRGVLPFDWLTSSRQAPRVFDDACLALLELAKPSSSATSYTGAISFTSAAP